MKKNDLETKDWVRKKIWVLGRCFGRWRNWKDGERSREMNLKLWGVYLNEIDKPWSIESYRHLKMHLLAVEPAIEDLMRGFLNKEAWWIEVTIDELLRRQKVSWLIKIAIESYQECDKKKLKGLNRQLNYRELLRLLKNSFLRENTNTNAIKHATQPNIQSTF